MLNLTVTHSHTLTHTMVLIEDTTLLPPTVCVQLEDELCINGANRSGGRRFRLDCREGGVGSVTVFSLVWGISTIDGQSSSFASLSSGTLLAT